MSQSGDRAMLTEGLPDLIFTFYHYTTLISQRYKNYWQLVLSVMLTSLCI